MRHAISQLYEYRFLHSLFDASLWIVFSTKPFSKWYINYLLVDRTINILWIEKALLHKSNRITLGHSQRRHFVQGIQPEQHFRVLSGLASGPKRVAEQRLQAEHRGFHQAAPMVAALALPLSPAYLTDAPQVLVTG